MAVFVTNVVATAGIVILKVWPALHGPGPPVFQVCTHQVYDPLGKVIAGVTEQVASAVPAQAA